MTGIESLAVSSFNIGLEAGRDVEQIRITSKLTSYLELVNHSIKMEGAEKNEQWILGFCAAMALVARDR